MANFLGLLAIRVSPPKPAVALGIEGEGVRSLSDVPHPHQLRRPPP